MSDYYKGICYEPFPKPYDPSTANNTCIFYGSDIAYDPIAPLWGKSYTSSTGSSCDKCRNDLQTLKDMGVNLIRLYDWDARNNHWNFMNKCSELGIKILAPVSNWWLTDGWKLPNKLDLVKGLIKSFLNLPLSFGTDYHPAIAGIIIGNEPGLNGISTQRCIEFTNLYATAEAQYGGGVKLTRIPLGHPVDFSLYGGKYPCWGFWQPLIDSKSQWFVDRLFLAPQTYNGADYLFKNAEGSGKGYVELTYQQFKKPILFTEIGQDRTKDGYLETVKGQLTGCRTYSQKNPGQLLGTCYFEFADKVWMQGTSEGSFGACSHTDTILCTVTYGGKDFTHWEVDCTGDTLSPDALTQNPVYDVLVKS
ncbi:MAG: hypothetical protein A2Y80_07285 [Deltaproteobacteria bacterium RBG_13_58_19]|nr:MAG: hypothetical protein A2Y80_07285 [Deltaproteobacteria bacterium RBG_13_58_19]